MFDCRIKKDKFPKEGEVVVGKIVSITNESITLELLEYGNIHALILNPEASKRKFKHITQMTKVGGVEVCTVSSVDLEKSYIDLSLKKPSSDETNNCKDIFAKNKIAYQIMSKVAKLANITVSELYEEWGYKKMEEYDNLYHYFAKVKEDLHLLDNEKYGDLFKKIIEEQFKASTYKVRVDVDVTCAIEGVKGLKKAFLKALETDKDLEITLLKSPIYSIVKISGSKDESFDAVNSAAEILKNEIEKLGGTFSIVVPAKLYGEKSKHTMLDEPSTIKDSDDEEESE